MEEKHLHLYLDLPTLLRVQEGTHHFFKRMTGLLEKTGWRVELHEETPDELLAAPERSGKALFHMLEPTHQGALTCRRTYVGAFWHIEASAARWEWPVAKTDYDPSAVWPKPAKKFFEFWRNRLFPETTPRDDGYVFVPLQGRLTEHRSFQSMSPIEMLETTLQQTEKPIVATLHPSEDYSRTETRALDDLTERYSRLTVSLGGSNKALRDCSYVVSQNSSLAFMGYFLKKPSVLFAGADFHHIAGSVVRDGIEGAFEKLDEGPDFERYLFWFLKQNCLNAGNPEFDTALPKALRKHGWPM